MSSAGQKAVQKAIDGESAVVLIHLRVALRYLRTTERRDWQRPEAARLKTKVEIYEIRFKAAKKQFRPLGFFGPVKGQFTIVVWATKKQDIYKPFDAINTAAERYGHVLAGQATTLPLQIAGEDFSASEEEGDS